MNSSTVMTSHGRKLPIKITLPRNFLKEEIRDGYKVTRETKELWAIELDLLCEFRRVCDKYDITWYADAGTILGATRHNGFIPWDDDIDVMMMRDQYDKLCSVAEKEFKAPYFFQTEHTDPGSARGHAQLRNSKTTALLESEIGSPVNYNCGIFIDIFPIDSIPNGQTEFETFHKRICLERKIYLTILRYGLNYRKSKSKTPIRGLMKAFLHVAFKGSLKNTYRVFYERYERDCAAYKNTSDTYNVAKLFDLPLKEKRIWPRTDFDTISYLPFEMFSIPVPSGYLDILDRFYGNWQKYKVGTSTHGGLVFDARVPYKEYIRQYLGRCDEKV